MKLNFTEDEILFIKENYENMTYKEMSNYLTRFSEKQIKYKAGNLGLFKTRKRKINTDYFHIIDSPIKAYFLGYIYADGYIVCNERNGNYELGMQLQECDKYILERFNQELGGVNIIYHKDARDGIIKGMESHSGETNVLRIYSKQIVQDLIQLGVECNKSKKSAIPHVDQNLFFDFLRGYIDGDGCFYQCKNHTYMHITCGNKEPLVYIQNVLSNFNIETRIYQENEFKFRLMCVNSEEMKKLVNSLYYSNDLFCLSRKFEKVKEYLSLAEQ